MNIYELFVNLTPTSKNKNFKDKTGTFVYVYVPAIELEHSIDKMKERIALDDFSLKNIEHVRAIDLDEWDEERDEDNPTFEQLSQLLYKNSYIYSCFHSYEFEHEH